MADEDMKSPFEDESSSDQGGSVNSDELSLHCSDESGSDATADDISPTLIVEETNDIRPCLRKDGSPNERKENKIRFAENPEIKYYVPDPSEYERKRSLDAYLKKQVGDGHHNEAGVNEDKPSGEAIVMENSEKVRFMDDLLLLALGETPTPEGGPEADRSLTSSKEPDGLTTGDSIEEVAFMTGEEDASLPAKSQERENVQLEESKQTSNYCSDVAGGSRDLDDTPQKSYRIEGRNVPANSSEIRIAVQLSSSQTLNIDLSLSDLDCASETKTNTRSEEIDQFKPALASGTSRENSMVVENQKSNKENKLTQVDFWKQRVTTVFEKRENNFSMTNSHINGGSNIAYPIISWSDDMYFPPSLWFSSDESSDDGSLGEKVENDSIPISDQLFYEISNQINSRNCENLSPNILTSTLNSESSSTSSQIEAFGSQQSSNRNRGFSLQTREDAEVYQYTCATLSQESGFSPICNDAGKVPSGDMINAFDDVQRLSDGGQLEKGQLPAEDDGTLKYALVNLERKAGETSLVSPISFNHSPRSSFKYIGRDEALEVSCSLGNPLKADNWVVERDCYSCTDTVGHSTGDHSRAESSWRDCGTNHPNSLTCPDCHLIVGGRKLMNTEETAYADLDSILISSVQSPAEMQTEKSPKTFMGLECVLDDDEDNLPRNCMEGGGSAGAEETNSDSPGAEDRQKTEHVIGTGTQSRESVPKHAIGDLDLLKKSRRSFRSWIQRKINDLRQLFSCSGSGVKRQRKNTGLSKTIPTVPCYPKEIYV